MTKKILFFPYIFLYKHLFNLGTYIYFYFIYKYQFYSSICIKLTNFEELLSSKFNHCNFNQNILFALSVTVSTVWKNYIGTSLTHFYFNKG